MSHIKPQPSQRRSSSSSNHREPQPKNVKVLQRWIAELRRRFSPLPPNTTSIFFRFLFPEEDRRRKYDMQETILAKCIAQVLGVTTDSNGSRGARLKNWTDENTFGCLGAEVRTVMEATCIDPDSEGQHTFRSLDNLLDELASLSAFSARDLRKSSASTRRSRASIMHSIFDSLPPMEAAIITQIILKDLRPLLYPLSETHFTVALKKFNTNAFHVLTKEMVLSVWDPSGSTLACYRLRSTLDEAAAFCENNEGQVAEISIGVPVKIPSSVKGKSCSHSLSHFRESKTVWAETKYDGERMQIHVNVDATGHSNITIFSKSQRDSTLDRIATHWIIRESLGLVHRGSHPSAASATNNEGHRMPPVQSIILEAEMVAFSEVTERIDEFWRIRSLIEATAYGPRRNREIRKNVPAIE